MGSPFPLDRRSGLGSPSRGITGVEAQGLGSRITAEDITIRALGVRQTGILGVEALNGGLVTLNGGNIKFWETRALAYSPMMGLSAAAAV